MLVMPMLKDMHTEALENYENDVWELFREYGNMLMKDVESNTPNSLARLRMFIFMVGRGYSATTYSIRPWQDVKLSIDALARELTECIREKLQCPDYSMAKILERLDPLSKINNKRHPSLISKVCHILWPEECPIYDKFAVRTLGMISKPINNASGNTLHLPTSVSGWDLYNLGWDAFIKNITDVRVRLHSYDSRIVDFHALDIILWYYGQESKRSDLCSYQKAFQYVQSDSST